MHGHKATAVVKEQMYEQIQNRCQPLTYLEQGVILHTARKINPFLLSPVLYSGIPALAIILLKKQLQKDKGLKN